MDKILSARVDDTIIHRIGALARQLGTTKKAIIENAVLCYAEQIEQEQNTDVLAQTCGAWKRDETPNETVEEARQTFRKSMNRFQT